MTLGSLFRNGLLPLYAFPLIVVVLKKPWAETPEPAAQTVAMKREREDARMVVEEKTRQKGVGMALISGWWALSLVP